MANKTVFQSQRLQNWGVLRIVRSPDRVQGEQELFKQTFNGFVDTLEGTLGKDQVTSTPKFLVLTVHRGNEEILREHFVAFQKEGIRFLLIVLPDNDASTYKQIKRLGDVDYGISTVCVLGEDEKFYKQHHSVVAYYANVALKINLKLGGINHTLRNHTALYETTMVIGIDVTHPSPGPTKKTAPSVAAMVASVDKEVLPSSHPPPILRKTPLM